MKNIKKARIERVDKGFSQRIADKYTHLKLFTIHFAPLISTKRIRRRMRILELIYAMPYLVLRREIVNSFNKTKNIFTSIKQLTWTIFVHLELPLSRSTYLLSGSERKPSTGMGEKLTISNDRIPMVHKIISSLMELAQPLELSNYQVPAVTSQLSNVIHIPSDISNKNQASYMQLYPYEHLERVLQNQEQKIVSYQPPIESLEPSAVSYKNMDRYIRPTDTPLTKLAQLVTRESAKVETGFEIPGISHKPAVFHTKAPEKTIPHLSRDRACRIHAYRNDKRKSNRERNRFKTTTGYYSTTSQY
jgi:hypothetical protein